MFCDYVPGEHEWFKEQRADEKKCQKMITHYKSFQQAVQLGEKSGKYVIAIAKEQLRSTSLVEVDEQGEMMDEFKWMDHAVNVASPKMSVVAAKAVWDQWMADPENAGRMTQVKSGVRKFRVETKTLVSFKTQLAQDKILELQGKQVKNPNEDDIRKMSNSILRGHGKVGVDDVDFRGRAAQMLQAGGDSAFNNNNLLVGQIRGLLPDDGEEEADDTEQKSGTPDGGSGSGKRAAQVPAEPQPAPKRRWVDQDKLLLAAQRDLEKILAPKEVELNEIADTLDREIKELELSDVNCKNFFKSELAMGRTRLEGLQAIKSTEEELATYKKRFAVPDQPAGSSAASASSTVSGSHVLGSAAP